MIRSLAGWTVSFGLIASTIAEEPFPRVPPTPADKAEATFEVLHGFRMELIAAEPLVASPVDMAYDEDGRAYVVEMRDYPFPEEKNAEPAEFPGTVSLLEDTDGDGRFDRSTIFADQLAWPTSVACWKGGVFVAAAPDIWYFKDTDGNRQADIRRKVFTGFGRYNVQAIMNNLRWGLDNKIYGAAAGNGGSIRPAERAGEPAISLARRDFRFDPVSEKFEATSGGERFGNTFDDWGNRFVCNIRNPVQHVVLEQRDLARNPHLVVPRVIHDCAESGDQLQVFRISPPEPWRVFRAQRWSLEGATMPRSELIGAGYWTSSSGVTVYRGGAYPPAFRGNVFIGEVAGNLVHRQLLTREGATFKSTRADENTEFIRSRDNWFRPVNFVNAPDGTLHVLDMYRETIEHPWSIPDDIKARLDLSSGKERGRIYRLAPPNFASPPLPRLSAATTAELVAHLESPHSWYRETAQRLLVERQDKAALVELHRLARKSKHALASLHALYTLQALGDLTAEDIYAAPAAGQPEFLRHVVVLSEPLYQQSDELRHLLYVAARSSHAFVQLQAAVSVGGAESKLALYVLTEVAHYGADDPWIRSAIIASSLPIAAELAEAIDQPGGDAGAESRRALMRELAVTIGAQGDRAVIERLLTAMPEPATLAGIGQGLARRREKLSDHLPHLPALIRERLDKQMSYATRLATDSRAHAYARLEAIHLLAFLPWADVRGALLTCMEASQPREVQQAALSAVGTFDQAEVPSELISRWKQLTPPLREESVNILLSRALWHAPLIEGMENGDILLSQLSIPQRARLAAVKDAGLAPRVQQLLGKFALGPRKEVLDKYQPSLTLPADATRGAVVYRRECANCHKLGGEGHEVGPNLATIQHRSPQEILIHVLDPNREVSPHFLDFSVRLSDGRVLTGLIASESDGGLVLRRAEGREDAVARSDIDEITASGKSLMPEGLEQKINEQEMADLVGYLRSAP